MSTEVVIVGAGGHGSEVYSYLRDLQDAGEDIRCLGFVDEVRPRGPFGDSEVLGDFQAFGRLLAEQRDRLVHYITAIGDNDARRAFVDKLDSLGAPNLHPWTLVHPRAYVGRDVEIGGGSLVAPGSVITARVRIGAHCIVNVRASVSHDCNVGDFANINPGAVLAGTVSVGRSGFVGAGATVVQRLRLGARAVVGAGAVVIMDVPDDVTVVGVPARIIKAPASTEGRSTTHTEPTGGHIYGPLGFPAP